MTQTLAVSPIKTALGISDVASVGGHVSFLLLGIGGAKHDGPNLSDSIIVADYNLQSNTLTTIGIPRDIWSSTLQDKINSAYAYGEAKQKEGGLKLAKAEVSAIVGIPVQYGAVIDFNHFQQLIDFLGGVDVNVTHAFTDHDYPIDGKENDLCDGDKEFRCRYETIMFNVGETHMDGTTALKFARSRHAVGSEGSDFARSQRQQLVISAARTKMHAIAKSGNITKITQLYELLNDVIHRDISNQQAAIIARNIAIRGNLKQYSFTLARELYEVPDVSLYGKYVLIPQKNDAEIVHTFVHCLIDTHNADTCLPLEYKGQGN